MVESAIQINSGITINVDANVKISYIWKRLNLKSS